MVAARDLFKLDQIGAPCLGALVDALQVRLVPKPSAFQV